MNIVTEPKLSGKPIVDKPHKRPVRLVRWFIVVGLLLTLLVGGLVWFNYFRGKMIAQFFANNKPPPTSVKEGTPLLQMFDGPEQGDLANFKAQQRVAQITLDRAKQLAERQVGPQATVETAQAAVDQASAGIAKTQAIISPT